MIAKYFIKVGGFYKCRNCYFHVLDEIKDVGRSGTLRLVLEGFYLKDDDAKICKGEWTIDPNSNVEPFESGKFYRIQKMLSMALNAANAIAAKDGRGDNTEVHETETE